MSEKKPTFHIIPKQTIPNLSILASSASAKNQASTSNTTSTTISFGEKKNKRILTEEEYISSLETIIQRDFFPDLKRLKVNAEYIDALDSGNVERMREIAIAAYHQHQQEQQELSDKKVRNLKLDEFQAIYTSEDNASFADIIESENRVKRETMSRLHRDRLLEAQEKKFIESGEKKLIKERKEFNIQNALMWVPNGHGSKTVRTNEQTINYANTRAPRESVVLDFTKRAESMDGNSPDVIGGYRLLANTPSPAPQRGGQTPLMTWGEVESPALIQSETIDVNPGPEFKMPALPRREELKKIMGDKATREMTRRKKTPTPQINNRLLSPAAQNLLKKARISTPKQHF